MKNLPKNRRNEGSGGIYIRKISRERVKKIEELLEDILIGFPHNSLNEPYKYKAEYEKGQYKVTIKVESIYEIIDYNNDSII